MPLLNLHPKRMCSVMQSHTLTHTLQPQLLMRPLFLSLSFITVNDSSKQGKCNPAGAMCHNSEFHSPLREGTGKQQAAMIPHTGGPKQTRSMEGGRVYTLPSQLHDSRSERSNSRTWRKSRGALWLLSVPNTHWAGVDLLLKRWKVVFGVCECMRECVLYMERLGWNSHSAVSTHQ